MILPFRIALMALGAAFAYLFGETSEKFLLEVIRAFVPIEASNAVLFNAVHILISIVPLVLLGIIVSVSLGGEKSSRVRLWSLVLGLALGIASFRIYQIWWVFRGGIGDEAGAWTESTTVSRLFFLEKICPFLILGGISSLTVAVFEKEDMLLLPILSAGGAFLWLLITHKIQNVSGLLQTVQGFFAAVFPALLIALFVKKIKTF